MKADNEEDAEKQDTWNFSFRKILMAWHLRGFKKENCFIVLCMFLHRTGIWSFPHKEWCLWCEISCKRALCQVFENSSIRTWARPPLAFCSEAMDLHTRYPTCLIPTIQRRVESRTRTEASYCEKTLFIQLFNIRKRWFLGDQSDLKKSRLQDLISSRSHLIIPATNPSMKLRRLRDDIFRELFLNFFCCCVPFLEHQKLQNQQHTTFKLHLTMPILVFSLVKWKIDRSLGLWNYLFAQRISFSEHQRLRLAKVKKNRGCVDLSEPVIVGKPIEVRLVSLFSSKIQRDFTDIGP